jgi:beta-lactamase regulating signal transducer with metallopeptidase domain
MNEELDHNKSILLHEFTHALNADPQENTIANILSTDPRVYYNRNFD